MTFLKKKIHKYWNHLNILEAMYLLTQMSREQKCFVTSRAELFTLIYKEILEINKRQHRRKFGLVVWEKSVYTSRRPRSSQYLLSASCLFSQGYWGMDFFLQGIILPCCLLDQVSMVRTHTTSWVWCSLKWHHSSSGYGYYSFHICSLFPPWDCWGI